MLGLMQDRPLLISSLIEHANSYHQSVEIVSRTVEGPIHRCTYGDIHRRARQMAKALSVSEQNGWVNRESVGTPEKFEKIG